MLNFATITFVGPGEQDAVRLRELLASLYYYEPQVSEIVLIDDQSQQDFDELIPQELKSRTAILDNPRRGRGDWWQGGLCVGLCAAFTHLAQETSLDFAVRVDTDALVINSFSDRIQQKFQAHDRAGLLGTWDKYPIFKNSRLPHPYSSPILAFVLKKAARRFAVWRHSDWPTRVQTPLSAHDRLVRRMILAAQKSGYRLGDYLQGGGYAIRGELIRDASMAGFLSESAYMHQFYGEDVLATLLCFAVKFQPFNFNDPGEVFAVSQGLCGPPEALVENDYAILHSYKNDENLSETGISEFFRNRRK